MNVVGYMVAVSSEERVLGVTYVSFLKFGIVTGIRLCLKLSDQFKV